MYRLSALLLAGTALVFAASCGSDDDDKDTTTETSYTFTADVNPILKDHCGNSGCHGTTGAASTVFVDAKAAFIASSSKERMALDTSNALFMPKGNSATFTAAMKKILDDYLSQTTQN